MRVDLTPNNKFLICGNFNLLVISWSKEELNLLFYPVIKNNDYKSINFIDTVSFCGLNLFSSFVNSSSNNLDLIMSNGDIVKYVFQSKFA